MDNWVSYIFVIFITALITAIITENAVISRITLSDGVGLIAGKCRLTKGFGKLNEQNQNQTTLPLPLDQQTILYNIQNDINLIKNKLFN